MTDFGATVHAQLPSMSLEEEEYLFGWVHGRVVTMLRKVGPGQVRSGRMLVSIDELLELAAQELAEEDAAAG